MITKKFNKDELVYKSYIHGMIDLSDQSIYGSNDELNWVKIWSIIPDDVSIECDWANKIHNCQLRTIKWTPIDESDFFIILL